MYSLSKSAVGRAVKMARCQKLPDYKHIVNIGNRKIFHVSEESAIADYLQTSSNMCYGLTKLQTRQLAYKYGIALNSNSIPESWHQNKMAGKQWLESFLIRHPKLSLRKPEKVSLARATAFNEHTVSMFFDNLLEVQLKYKFKPECIFNADETGLLTVTDPPKIISTRGTKRVSQAVSAERGSLVTMLAFVNAMGNTVPPVFIFPRVNYKDFMICGAPTGSLGLCNKSGWMTSENFLVAMKHFVSHAKPSVEHPVLLLMDNHESHISFETITFAKENSLILLTFPPHCSHRLQPLDVSVFGPFKSYFRLAQNEWLASNPGRIINIYNLPQLACKAYNMSFTIKNVCSGFSKCGIYTLNRQIFGESDFISSSVSDRPLLVEQPEIKQPDIQQSYEINKQVDSSESSVKIVSPESIHPYPKAPPRKDSKKRRKQGKSTILTKTPEKTVNKNIFETGKITTQNLKRKIDLKRGKETEIFDADFLIVSSVKNAPVNQQQQNTCKICKCNWKNFVGPAWIQCFTCQWWICGNCNNNSKKRYYECELCEVDC